MVSELGQCSAAVPHANSESEGLNGGYASGRACWNVEGSSCRRLRSDLPGKSFTACLACEVFQQVQLEEEAAFVVRLRKPEQRKVMDPRLAS
ncbi:MAG: hypothetical protein ACI9D0_001989 [Bacteroidia bacterium]|jgi:hypothetical protein